MDGEFDINGISPTPNAVRVSNISPSATNAAVCEFFAFCGSIVRFQMIKKEDSNMQEALIIFEKESSANTSLLLTNAVIVDRSVIVRPFFELSNPQDPVAAAEETERAAAAGEPTKPVTRVIAELLASGYTLTLPLLNMGIELDRKFQVTRSVSSMIAIAQDRAVQLNERYGVTGKLRSIDSRFHLTDSASRALATASMITGRALSTPTGQRVVASVTTARDKAIELAAETRSIAQQKLSPDDCQTPVAEVDSHVSELVPS